MPRPWRITYSGAKYHVTSRGNGRQNIFLCDDDYIRFLDQLALALAEDEVILYSYALMSNHYHLFIETPLGNLKKFMQRLNTAYSMYYRYKHTKPGHCFQGRYGAKLVDGDDYILRLTRYIHLNPIKIKSRSSFSFDENVKYLQKYKWCSYAGYINEAEKEDIIDYRWLKMMGLKTARGSRTAYRKYLDVMICKNDEEYKMAMAVSRYAVGSNKFIEQVESDVRDFHVEKGCVGRDVFLPKEREILISDIEAEISKLFKVPVSELLVVGRRVGYVKGLLIEMICQLTCKSQREIAVYFGYTDASSIGKQRKQTQVLLKKDDKLRKKYQSLKNKILLKYGKAK